MSKKKPEIKQTPVATPARRKRAWLWIAIVAVVLAAAAVLTICLWPAKVTTKVPDGLDAVVVSTLRDVHYSDHTATKFPAVTYTTLCVEEKGDDVTVYGVMMYREYTCTIKGELRTWASANEAFVLTAEKTDKGYVATDLWWPESGAEYISSIMEKFPKSVRKEAVDAQQYAAAHEATCQEDARRNIADEDKYVVMESEGENLRLAYCAGNNGAYIIFGGGYNTDGTYRQEGDTMLFTLKEKSVTLSFTIDGDALVYDAEASANVPSEWQTIGENEYLTDGVVFKPEGDASSTPETPKDTAPMGATVTASSTGWMSEEELREMFGQYVPSTYFDSADPKYLPVRPIETRAQLDRFIAAYEDSWTGINEENFAQFDEAFFEENYLMMTYYRDGMASCEPKISEYVYVQDGTSLWLSVRLEVTRPAAGDTVVGQWVLFSGIAKTDFKKSTGLEAYVEKTVTAEAASAELTLTGTVKEIDGNAMLLECEDNSQFTTVWVELGDAELDPMVGETYVVTYEDLVMTSLPPRITAITITKS